jgi:hypothetical protein
MPECGATTASGATCKCRVKDGRCRFHRGGEDCSVCLADLTGACKTLPCGHTFHRRCILQWRERGNHTCPVCRASFAPPQPEYRITVTVQPRGREPRVFSTNTLPDMLRNIITPETDMTEILIDVATLESLGAVLTDLGIGETLNNFRNEPPS